MDPTRLSRRELIALLAGAISVGGCGITGPAASTTGVGFGGARLRAVLSRSFIDELSDIIRAHSERWSDGVDADIDLAMQVDAGVRSREAARQRQGEDIAEFSGNAPYEHADRLVDVTDLAESIGERSGGWLPAARDLCVVDGRWRAIPWAYSTSQLNYRPSVIEATGADVPTTYDEVLDVATRLREQRLPLAGFRIAQNAPGDSSSLAFSLLWSFGGREVDSDGRRVTIDSAATRAALTYWKELAAVGSPRAFAFDEGGNNTAFLDGEVSMTQNGPSILWAARSSLNPIGYDTSLATLPSGPNGSHQLINVHSLGVFQHSRNPAAAEDWIRAMLGPNEIVERASASIGHYSPTLLGPMAHPEMPWNADPDLAGLRDPLVDRHHVGWPGPASLEAELAFRNATIVKMFEAVGQGTLSVDRAMAVAANELSRVYET